MATEPGPGQQVTEARLLNYRVNGWAPFLSHADALGERLDEASALLSILAVVHHDEAGAPPDAEGSIRSLNPSITAAAFEGIQTLVHLAQYHADNLKVQP